MIYMGIGQEVLKEGLVKLGSTRSTIILLFKS